MNTEYQILHSPLSPPTPIANTPLQSSILGHRFNNQFHTLNPRFPTFNPRLRCLPETCHVQPSRVNSPSAISSPDNCRLTSHLAPVTAHEGLRLGWWIMVVARICARAYLFGRLSLWLSVWVNFRLLFGSTSRGVCGVSLYGLMLCECFCLSFGLVLGCVRVAYMRGLPTVFGFLSFLSFLTQPLFHPPPHHLFRRAQLSPPKHHRFRSSLF
jgi:hypothetical protein